MLEKLKKFMFPCEERMKLIIAEREKAMEQNFIAHGNLIAACSPKFTELCKNKIVNPR